MIKRHWLKYIVVALLFLAACSPSGGEVASTETLSGEEISDSENSVDELPEGVEPQPEPNPIDLTVNLEEGNTTEGEIGIEGGELEVTAADGTHFLLVVPSEALFSPVTISITPAESVEGVPFEAGALAAVHLEPEGLIFYRPVELFIKLPGDVSLDEIVSFGTFAGGKDFYLHPGSKEAGEVRLLISHFTNYGLTAARQAEINYIKLSYTPSQSDAYAKDQAVLIVDQVDDPAAQLDAYEKIARQWFNNSVLTRLKNAAVVESRINSAIGEYLAWFQFVEMMGLLTEDGTGVLIQRLDPEINLALDAIAAALKNAFQKAHQRCVQENKPEEALEMVRWGMVASYLKVWGRAGFDQKDAQAKVAACFSFDFVFRSTIDGKIGLQSFISQVFARIPLKITLLSTPVVAFIQNKGDLVFELNSLTPGTPECASTSKSGEMLITIKVDLNFNYLFRTVDSLDLNINIINPPEESLRCNVSGFITNQPFPRWWPGYSIANERFLDKVGGSFDYHLPIIREGEVFARLELHGLIKDLSEEEASTYELVHTPEK